MSARVTRLIGASLLSLLAAASLADAQDLRLVSAAAENDAATVRALLDEGVDVLVERDALSVAKLGVGLDEGAHDLGIVQQSGGVGKDPAAQPVIVIGQGIIGHLGGSGLSHPDQDSSCRGMMRPGVARMRRGAARKAQRPAKGIRGSSDRSWPNPS